jgi:hypothetical protein
MKIYNPNKLQLDEHKFGIPVVEHILGRMGRLLSPEEDVRLDALLAAAL